MPQSLIIAWFVSHHNECLLSIAMLIFVLFYFRWIYFCLFTPTVFGNRSCFVATITLLLLYLVPLHWTFSGSDYFFSIVISSVWIHIRVCSLTLILFLRVVWFWFWRQFLFLYLAKFLFPACFFMKAVTNQMFFLWETNHSISDDNLTSLI